VRTAFATHIGPVFATGPEFLYPHIHSTSKGKAQVSLPNVFVSTGAVTVIAPTTNTDGTPVTPGEITSYNVGVRSLTATGSVAGTYPFNGSLASNVSPLSMTLKALGVSKADSYAAAAQAVTANGTTAWGPEFSFTAAPSLPQPPAVSVA